MLSPLVEQRRVLTHFQAVVSVEISWKPRGFHRNWMVLLLKNDLIFAEYGLRLDSLFSQRKAESDASPWGGFHRLGKDSCLSLFDFATLGGTLCSDGRP